MNATIYGLLLFSVYCASVTSSKEKPKPGDTAVANNPMSKDAMESNSDELEDPAEPQMASSELIETRVLAPDKAELGVQASDEEMVIKRPRRRRRRRRRKRPSSTEVPPTEGKIGESPIATGDEFSAPFDENQFYDPYSTRRRQLKRRKRPRPILGDIENTDTPTPTVETLGNNSQTPQTLINNTDVSDNQNVRPASTNNANISHIVNNNENVSKQPANDHVEVEIFDEPVQNTARQLSKYIFSTTKSIPDTEQKSDDTINEIKHEETEKPATNTIAPSQSKPSNGRYVKIRRLPPASVLFKMSRENATKYEQLRRNQTKNDETVPRSSTYEQTNTAKKLDEVETNITKTYDENWSTTKYDHTRSTAIIRMTEQKPKLPDIKGVENQKHFTTKSGEYIVTVTTEITDIGKPAEEKNEKLMESEKPCDRAPENGIHIILTEEDVMKLMSESVEANAGNATSMREVKDDILSMLRTRAGFERLRQILQSRNMTLDDLIRHRERGSSQLHFKRVDKTTANYDDVTTSSNITRKSIPTESTTSQQVKQYTTQKSLREIEMNSTTMRETFQEKEITSSTGYGTTSATLAEVTTMETTIAPNTNQRRGKLYENSRKGVNAIPFWYERNDTWTPSTTKLILSYATTEINFPDSEENILPDSREESRKLERFQAVGPPYETYRKKEKDRSRKISVVMKTAILVSVAILGVAILGFFTLLVTCKIKRQKCALRSSTDTLCEQPNHNRFRQSSRSTSPVLLDQKYRRSKNYVKQSNISSNRNYYLWNTLGKTFQYE